MCCAFHLHGLKSTRQKLLQPQARKRPRDGSRARLARGSGTRSRPRGPAARQPGSSTRHTASAVLPLRLPGPVFCPPGSQGLLHFQHHTCPVPEIGREEDGSQSLLNWEPATAGLVRVGKPSPLWTEPPFVSFDPKTETPGHRMAGVCALIPSDGNVQARLVPSSKPSTAPKVTGGCRGLTWGCQAFQLGPTEDCTGLTQDGEICFPWKHSQRGCNREVVGGGTGSRRQSRPDFWLCSQPCRAEGHSQGLRVYSLGSCCLLLLPEVHLGPGLRGVQPLLAGSVLRV